VLRASCSLGYKADLAPPGRPTRLRYSPPSTGGERKKRIEECKEIENKDEDKGKINQTL
jgi:hypothetical protein